MARSVDFFTIFNAPARTICAYRIRDLSQLRKDYRKEQADVLMNITGNLISGQVSGDTAKQLSERFGRIQQDRTVLSVNQSDTTVARSVQLDLAVPASKITSLSPREFVRMLADNPDEPVALKSFHCRIINDHKALTPSKSLSKRSLRCVVFQPRLWAKLSCTLKMMCGRLSLRSTKIPRCIIYWSSNVGHKVATIYKMLIP